MATSGMATWTAPTMTSRGRRGNASMNHDRPSSSTVRDRPRSRASAARPPARRPRPHRPVVPSKPPSAPSDQGLPRGSRPPPAGAARTPGPGESAGRGVMTATPGSRAADSDRVGYHGLHQHVDGAATGEAHIPRLLVADAIPDDPRVARRARPLDLLVGGTLHAAAADRSGQPAVTADEQHGSLRTRRRAERPDDHRPRGRRCPRPAARPPRRRARSTRSFIGAWCRCGRRRHRRAPPPAAPGCPGRGTAGTRRCAARPPPCPRRAACNR